LVALAGREAPVVQVASEGSVVDWSIAILALEAAAEMVDPVVMGAQVEKALTECSLRCMKTQPVFRPA
jgi:hypothetical protein